MPRRVDQIIPVKDSFECAAHIACENTDLIKDVGENYSERTGKIRKFVQAFIQENMRLNGTNRVDNVMGRLANRWFYYGMTRLVRRRRK